MGVVGQPVARHRAAPHLMQWKALPRRHLGRGVALLRQMYHEPEWNLTAVIVLGVGWGALVLIPQKVFVDRRPQLSGSISKRVRMSLNRAKTDTVVADRV